MQAYRNKKGEIVMSDTDHVIHHEVSATTIKTTDSEITRKANNIYRYSLLSTKNDYKSLLNNKAVGCIGV